MLDVLEPLCKEAPDVGRNRSLGGNVTWRGRSLPTRGWLQGHRPVPTRRHRPLRDLPRPPLQPRSPRSDDARQSIADVLSMTVAQAAGLFLQLPQDTPKLETLRDVGLVTSGWGSPPPPFPAARPGVLGLGNSDTHSAGRALPARVASWASPWVWHWWRACRQPLGPDW